VVVGTGAKLRFVPTRLRGACPNLVADDVVEDPDDDAAEEGADRPREGVTTTSARRVPIDQDGDDEGEKEGKQRDDEYDQEFDPTGDGGLEDEHGTPFSAG
jgi:hypothetical protein